MPAQIATPLLSIVPVASSRSSYNGLLVFIFIALSASLAGYSIHRLASRAVRRGPAWDGGFPNANPATQYTAGSFAQPIRRVFGATLFLARRARRDAAAGQPRAGSLRVDVPRPSPGNGCTCR